MRTGPDPCPIVLRAAAGALALCASSVATPAQAALEAVIAPIVVDAVSRCRLDARPLVPAAPALGGTAKTVALLGGAPSALDAIRAQQTAPAASPAMVAKAEIAVPALVPGANVAALPATAPAVCAALAASHPQAVAGTMKPLTAAGPDDFLASKRIRIARTNFDSDWKRVRADAVSHGAARRYLGALPADRDASLAAVNRWVNQRIRYAEDIDQYGKSDFWAGARKTLRARRGDCEDIALVKMQLLAAIGVPRDDMVLTIARDLVRNADHAVLVVRTEGGWRMLDNATDDVLDAAPQHDYRAILSFGDQTSWLHGV